MFFHSVFASPDSSSAAVYLPRLNYSVKRELSEVHVTPSNILKQLQSLEVNKASLGLPKKLLQVTGEVHEAKEKLAKLEERAKKQPEETNGEAKTGLPTDDHIEEQQKELDELTEKLENAERAQKQLFLIVFQRFIMILTEHIVRAEQQQLEVDTQWFKYTTERLREVLITNYEQVFKYLRSLETLLFTADLDSRILSLFSQFKALRT
ncbi:nuclear cap-binding protein subunit 1-like isoform X1 [Montipora capricornis]|uniref:nuclear cap-binding protein subunit 1-like isoform X1 n=1 Tax=Montipora capricornis TaxID=246305 RepID=UPI0035F1E6BC